MTRGAQCTFFLTKGFSKGLFRKNMKRRDFRRDCSGKIYNDGIFEGICKWEHKNNLYPTLGIFL